MKPKFLLPARRELIEAVQYYNAQRIRIGDEFRDEAWETLRRINDFPLAWHPLGGIDPSLSDAAAPLWPHLRADRRRDHNNRGCTPTSGTRVLAHAAEI